MPLNSVYDNGGIIGQTLDLGSTEQYISGTSTPSYVGGASASGSSTLSLTGITGLQEGDLVLFWATEDANEEGFYVTDSWTTVISANDNSIRNLVAYKVMGSTVDTSVSIYDATGEGNQDSEALLTIDALTATAWRGVDYTSITQRATDSGTSINPRSITVTNDNSVVLVLAAIDDDNSTISSPPTGYTTAVQNGRLGGSNAQMYKTGVSGGTEDPSSLSWSSGDALIAYTLVLSPQVTYGNKKNSGIWNLNAIHELAVRQEILSITSGSTVAAATGASITIPLPSNIEAGDILIAVGSYGTQTAAPSAPTGWTGDVLNPFNFAISKVATGSESAPVISKDTSGVDHVAKMFLIKKRNIQIQYSDGLGGFSSTGSVNITATTGTGSFGDLYLYHTFVGGPRTETTAVSNMTQVAQSGSTPAHAFYYALDIGGEPIVNQWDSSTNYRLQRYKLD